MWHLLWFHYVPDTYRVSGDTGENAMDLVNYDSSALCEIMTNKNGIS
jgi:hypothetical protein